VRSKLIVIAILATLIFSGCIDHPSPTLSEEKEVDSVNVKLYNTANHIFALCDGKISVISRTNNKVVGNIQTPRLIGDLELIDGCLIFVRSSKTECQIGLIKDNLPIQMKELPHAGPYQIEIFNNRIYISYSVMGPNGSFISVFDKELNFIEDIEIPFIANHFCIRKSGSIIVNYLDPKKAVRSLGVWENGDFRKLLSDKYKITNFVISPNNGNEILAVVNQHRAQLLIIDVTSGEIKKEINLNSKYPGNVTVNNNKAYIPHFGSDSHSPDTISIVDLNSYELKSEIKHISTPSYLIHKDSRLYASNHSRGTVTVINPATHKVIKILKTGERPWRLASK